MFWELTPPNILLMLAGLFSVACLLAMVMRDVYFRGYMAGYTDRRINRAQVKRAEQLTKTADLAGHQPIGAHVDQPEHRT